MSFSAIIIILVTVTTSAIIIYLTFRKLTAYKQVVLNNLSIITAELEEKKKVLHELANLSLGLTTVEIRDQALSDLAVEEDVLKSEKGKVTIVQSEQEAVDLRLRELEEIERELEASSIEANREVEMLRSQEKDFEQKNAHLKENLQSVFFQLDQLFLSLANSQEAIERLTAAKNDLIQTQEKIEYYETNLSMLNQKYMNLKKAYDALDIEYAQLYERQLQT